MLKLKMKSLYLALVAGFGAAGMASSASAVNVDANGFGQVLIYPYYSVRQGMDTYISLTNSSYDYKAIRVRFNEGKNGRPVLGFNLYLSPFDTWTAAIVSTSTGAKIVTADRSCTVPQIPSVGQNFVNYAYSGIAFDGESQSMDRTREGSVEIIEMGVIINTADQNAIRQLNGIPVNCGALQSLRMDTNAGVHAAAPPRGGLTGNATLLNASLGTEFTYDATALDNFSRVNIWYDSGNLLPDLRSATPVSDVYFARTNVHDSWAPGTAQAVTAVLMHNQVVNDYLLDFATLSGTDYVITMPTKHYNAPVYNPTNVYIPVPAVEPPFTKRFWTRGACEPVSLSVRGREAWGMSLLGSTLCWESTVLTFNNSQVLGSRNAVNIPTTYENGFATISLDGLGHTLVNPISHRTYSGLPVIGFAVQDSFYISSQFGGNFTHKYKTDIH